MPEKNFHSENGPAPPLGIIGASPPLKDLLEKIRNACRDIWPVLITGESGVGKELVARAVHAGSPLANRPFIPVDCANLAGPLMESELFGCVRGAFTGADYNRAGLVRAAEGGTLFLDEIGELSLEVQAKLLRLLQEGEIRPLGAERPIYVNVRAVAATNRNLSAEVEAGRFRQDLYYRLDVLAIEVPALRERREDVMSLARHFVEKCGAEPAFSAEAERALTYYDWPGNVRELENVIRKAMARSREEPIELADLPAAVRQGAKTAEAASGAAGDIEPLSQVERRHILNAVKATGGDLDAASARLGIGRTTIYRKLKRYRDESGSSDSGG